MPYREQPGFCAVCGQEGEYEFRARPVLCGDDCRAEYEWRRVLYLAGLPYRVRSRDAEEVVKVAILGRRYSPLKRVAG